MINKINTPASAVAILPGSPKTPINPMISMIAPRTGRNLGPLIMLRDSGRAPHLSARANRQSIGFGGVGFTNACGHLAMPYRSNRSDGINGLAAKPSNLGATNHE